MKNENVEQQLATVSKELAELKIEMEQMKRLMKDVHSYLMPPIKAKISKVESSQDKIRRYSEDFARRIKTRKK